MGSITTFLRMNLYTVLRAGFPADLSTPAIEVPGSSRHTWSDLETTVARLVNALDSLGIEPGARLVVQVEKSPEALMLYLATVRAGRVYVPFNIAYSPVEMDYLLGDARPAVVVCASKNLATISASATRVGARHVFTLDDDGRGTLIDLAVAQGPSCQTYEGSEETPAAILYTSGTTGRSKGAVLTHGNLASNSRVLREYWQWHGGDVLLHILPIFHAHGLFVAAQGALLAGVTMIWLPKFDGREVLRHLPRCTMLMGVPTHYVRLLGEPGFDASACRNMRLFISGSAPLLLETFHEFKRRTGHTILERYGMSETIMLVSNPCDSALGDRIGGTVGQPLPSVGVRVVDEHGRNCPPGQVGQIEVRGPNVFHEYWGAPEKTKEAFTPDGWFKTGDMGRWGGISGDRRVPDGYLSIVGRSKDLIISGGLNVYPKEVESAINGLPGVLESAVIGMPHPDFGEAVMAVVVAQAGVPLEPQAMIARLKGELASFKIPKRIEVIEALPRNAMGKVLKNELRKTYVG